MAENVELILKVDNTEAIRKIKETQLAVAEMNKTITGKGDEEIALIKNTIANLEKMKKATEDSFDTDSLDEYTRELSRLSDNLENVTDESDSMGKSTASTSSIAMKASIVIGALAGAYELLKKAIASTGKTADEATVKIAGMTAVFKGFLQSIVTGNLTSFLMNMKEIRLEGERYQKSLLSIRDANRELQKQTILSSTRIDEFKRVLNSSIATDDQKRDAIRRIYEEEVRLINLQQGKAKSAYETMITNLANETHLTEQAVKNMIEQDNGFQNLNKRMETYNDLLKQREILVASRTETATNKEQNIIKTEQIRLLDEQIKKTAEWIGIESLTKNVVIPVQERVTEAFDLYNETVRTGALITEEAESATKQFNEENAKQVKTIEEQTKALREADEALKNLIKDSRIQLKYEPPKETLDFLMDIGTLVGEKVPDEFEEGVEAARQEMGEMKKFYGDMWDEMNREAKEKSKKIKEDQIDFILGSIDAVSGEAFNLINTFGDNAKQVNDEYLSNLEERIAATQAGISEELELQRQGYANNVEARKKELERLQKEKEKAEKKDLEIRKRQKAVAIAQSIVDTASAVLKAYLSQVGIPIVGPALALKSSIVAGALGALQTATIIATKLAKGGSGTDTGIVEGKTHSQGGENFLSQIEVEKGEAWGVLSRPATQKYGDAFHEIVSSFNKDKPVIPSMTNVVNLDTKGQNRRLDRVINEQRKMNEQLAKQISVVGNKKIIRNGNKVRIVG